MSDVLAKNHSAISSINHTFTIYALIITGCVIALVCLLIFNPFGFSEMLGPGVMLSVVGAIAIASAAWYYPTVKKMGDKWAVGYLAATFILVAGIFMGMYTASQVSGASTMLNVAVISAIIAVLGLLVINRHSTSKTPATNSILNEWGSERLRYTGMLAVFVMCMVLVYMFNPSDVLDKYSGLVILPAFIIFVMLGFKILTYSYNINNADASVKGNVNSVGQVFTNGVIILFGLLLSVGAIWGGVTLLTKIFHLLSPTSSGAFSWIGRIIIACATIYAAFYAYTRYKDEKSGIISNTPSMVFTLIAVSGFLFLGKVMIPTIREFIDSMRGYGTGNRIKVLSHTMPLNIENTISSFHELNGDAVDLPSYGYAISFKVYIDSFPDNTATSTQCANILSYGTVPFVRYCSKTMSLIVGAKGDSDEEVFYAHPDFLLQRWHNITINYSNGTMDIFINGTLAKSIRGVVPYMTFPAMVIGENGGTWGDIDNVYYYSSPRTLMDIENNM